MKKSSISSSDRMSCNHTADRVQRQRQPAIKRTACRTGRETAAPQTDASPGRIPNPPPRRRWSSAIRRSTRKTGKRPLTPHLPSTAGPASAMASAKRWYTIPTAWSLSRGWQNHGKTTATSRGRSRFRTMLRSPAGERWTQKP